MLSHCDQCIQSFSSAHVLFSITAYQDNRVLGCFFPLFLRQWLFLMTQTNSSVEEVILCKFVRNYFHNLSVQKGVTFLIKSHGSRQIRRWRRRRDHQSWCSAVMYKNGYKIWTTGITKKGFGTKMTGKKFLIVLMLCMKL